MPESENKPDAKPEDTTLGTPTFEPPKVGPGIHGVLKKAADEFSQIGDVKFRIRLFNPKKPLYLPEGSIRAILTLMLLSTVIVYNFARLFMLGVYKCDLKDVIDMPEQLWTMAAAAVFFYFGSRKSPSKDGE